VNILALPGPRRPARCRAATIFSSASLGSFFDSMLCTPRRPGLHPRQASCVFGHRQLAGEDQQVFVQRDSALPCRPRGDDITLNSRSAGWESLPAPLAPSRVAVANNRSASSTPALPACLGVWTLPVNGVDALRFSSLDNMARSILAQASTRSVFLSGLPLGLKRRTVA